MLCGLFWGKSESNDKQMCDLQVVIEPELCEWVHISNCMQHGTWIHLIIWQDNIK